MKKTSEVFESIQEQGDFIRNNEAASCAEYEHLRNAIEDGSLVKIRQEVYVEQKTLANTMINIEKIVSSGLACLYSVMSGLIGSRRLRFQREALESV